MPADLTRAFNCGVFWTELDSVPNFTRLPRYHCMNLTCVKAFSDQFTRGVPSRPYVHVHVGWWRGEREVGKRTNAGSTARRMKGPTERHNTRHFYHSLDRNAAICTLTQW